MSRLLCMSFDGSTQLERPQFKTLEELWSYADDLGSKWFFYPFYFAVTNSGKTVIEAPSNLEFMNGMKVTTVSRMFKETCEKEAAKDADINEFLNLLIGEYK